jgi:RNA polymerase sigma-70 factor, ECF subfamily
LAEFCNFPVSIRVLNLAATKRIRAEGSLKLPVNAGDAKSVLLKSAKSRYDARTVRALMTELEKFEGFMKNYQDMVYSTALRLLGNQTDAQDIAQTVFLKAYESFAALSLSPTAGGWLKTVTTNLCLNHLTRYRARWKFFSEMKSDDDDREYSDTLAAPESNPHSHSLDETDQRQMLEAALHRLPDAQRVPLVLYHFEDRSYEAIAEKLGVSLSKVKTDIHRGRIALKRHLEPRRADLPPFTAPTQERNRP